MRKETNTGLQGPSREDVMAALEHLLQTDRLRRAPALCKLLSYVVERTLEGKERQLKAYTIAIEALGRGASFDPVVDPIVRVEAMRLRRVLEQYYADEGAASPVRISLPKGRYVPHFSNHPAAKTVAIPSIVSVAPTDINGSPRIQLLFQVDAPLDTGQTLLARSVERSLTDAITRFGFIHWTNPFSDLHGTGQGDAAQADFQLRVLLGADGEDLTCRYQVWENAGGTVICTDQRNLPDQVSLERVLGRLSSMVFGHSGCIHRHNLALLLSGHKFSMRYECKLRYLDVVRSHGNPAREAGVRQMLESQLQHDFGFAYGYVFLSHLLQRHALSLPNGKIYDELMLRSLHLALRAVELSHNASYIHAVLYWVADVRGDRAIAMSALQTALKLNPYDDEIQLAHGSRLICSGHPAYGIELMESRLSHDIQFPLRYLLFLALGKFLVGDITAAAAIGERIPTDLKSGAHSIPGAFLMTAVHAEVAGDKTRAMMAAKVMEDLLDQAGLNVSEFLSRLVHHEPSRLMIEQTYRAALNRQHPLETTG